MFSEPFGYKALGGCKSLSGGYIGGAIRFFRRVGFGVDISPLVAWRTQRAQGLNCVDGAADSCEARCYQR